MRPLQHQTWDSFSRNWDVDVRRAFHWIREALLQPLAPGSTVIVMSSGAALFGSPLSGGYAGAKATIRFITAYAADEAARAGRDIRFIARDREQYVERVGPGPQPDDVAHHITTSPLSPVLPNIKPARTC